ncbi:MAG: tripartite tricarboxylate transporter TctB family protein [Deltaproteobacteria bacterium]|nr:tripartite tricarboxylate transporter TctB family protein [Deltaproteobacteria bacterium]
MKMNRAYQITGVVFLLLAAFVARESLALKFYTNNGPGPGFFPFWLSIVLGLLAVLMILQATFRQSEPMPEGFFADRAGYLKVGAIVLALAVSTALLEIAGFPLTMLAVILFLLFVLGRPGPIVTLLVSAAGSFGCFYLFDRWLKVPLPTGFFGF